MRRYYFVVKAVLFTLALFCIIGIFSVPYVNKVSEHVILEHKKFMLSSVSFVAALWDRATPIA